MAERMRKEAAGVVLWTAIAAAALLAGNSAYGQDSAHRTQSGEIHRVDVLRAYQTPLDLGLRFNPLLPCRHVNVELDEGVPDYVLLGRYGNDGVRKGSLGRSFTGVSLGGGASGEHVRIYYDAQPDLPRNKSVQNYVVKATPDPVNCPGNSYGSIETGFAVYFDSWTVSNFESLKQTDAVDSTSTSGFSVGIAMARYHPACSRVKYEIAESSFKGKSYRNPHSTQTAARLRSATTRDNGQVWNVIGGSGGSFSIEFNNDRNRVVWLTKAARSRTSETGEHAVLVRVSCTSNSSITPALILATLTVRPGRSYDGRDLPGHTNSASRVFLWSEIDGPDSVRGGVDTGIRWHRSGFDGCLIRAFLTHRNSPFTTYTEADKGDGRYFELRPILRNNSNGKEYVLDRLTEPNQYIYVKPGAMALGVFLRDPRDNHGLPWEREVWGNFAFRPTVVLRFGARIQAVTRETRQAGSSLTGDCLNTDHRTYAVTISRFRVYHHVLSLSITDPNTNNPSITILGPYTGYTGSRHNSKPAGPFVQGIPAIAQEPGIVVGLHSSRNTSGGIPSNLNEHSPCRGYQFRTVTGANWTAWQKHYYHDDSRDGSPSDMGDLKAEGGNNHQYLRLKFTSMPGVGLHHVTLEFKPNQTKPNCSSSNSAAVTLGFTITIVDRYPWVTGPADSTRDDFFLPSTMPASLADGPFDTGIRIDRNSKACDHGDVELQGSDSGLFELRKYSRRYFPGRTTPITQPEGAAASSLTDVKMGFTDTTEDSTPKEYHARLFFKQQASGGQVSIGGEYTVEVKVEPANRCNRTGTPLAMTLTYAFTVNDAEGVAAWVAGRFDTKQPLPGFSDYFVPAYLSGKSSPTDTGIYIQRFTSECGFANLSIDDENKNLFEIYMMSKGQVRYNAGGGSSRTGVVMSDLYAGYAGLFFRSNAAIQAGVREVSITLSQDRLVCPPHVHLAAPTVLVYTLTVKAAEWHVGIADSTQARGVSAEGLDALTLHADTGVRIQRSSALCSDTVVSLTGPNAANFRMYGRTYVDVDRTPLASSLNVTTTTIPVVSDVAGDGITLNMREGGDRSYARLQFKPNLNWSEGVMRVSIAVSSSIDCGHANAVPNPTTLGYAITISSSTWSWQGAHVAYQPRALYAGDIAAATQPFYSGLAFNRSPAACRQVDVRLDSAPGYLFLARYQGNVPATETGLTNITIDSSAGANNHNVRLYFNRGASVPAGAITVNLVAQTNSGCSGDATTITMAWALTIDSGTGIAWEEREQHSDEASGEFLATDLAASVVPTFTGLAFNRSPNRCPHVNFTLVDPPAYIEASVYKDSGSAVTGGNAADRFTNIPMKEGDDFVPNDHVRLFFKANADVPVGRLTVTVRATESTALCSNLANELTTSFALTIVSASSGPVASSWETLSRDVAVQTRFYSPSELANSSARTDTGLVFHRSSSECRFIDVALSGSQGVELARYDDSEQATNGALMKIRMEERHADDNHVKLFYSAGAAVSSGATLSVTVIATANSSSCPGVSLEPLTVSWRLTVGGSIPPPQAQFEGPSRSTFYVAPEATGNTGITVEIRGSRRAEGHIITSPQDKFELLTVGAWNQSRLLVALGVRGTLTAGNTVAVHVYGVDTLDSTLQGNTLTFNIIVRDPGASGDLSTLNVDVGSRGIRSAGAHAIESVLDRPLPSGFGGFLEMLQNKESELESGDIDLREFLAGQSYAMPLLNANGDASAVGFWMQAEIASIEDDKTGGDDSLTYEGDIFNAAFGLDYRFSAFSAGLGYGIHELETDYKDATGKGVYRMDLGVILPYVSFDTVGGRLALAGGVGTGEVATTVGDRDEELRDADYTTYAFGYRHTLGERADKFRIKGLISNSSLDVEEQDGDAESLDADGGSLRLALGYVREIEFTEGGLVAPGVEFAYSTNWGDGNTGATYGAAANMGVNVDRLNIDGSYRYAKGEESTISGIVVGFRLSQSIGNLGLGFEARPSYGLDSTDALLDDEFEINEGALPKAELGLRTLVRMSYGLPVSGGVLTPYGGYEITGGSDVARELGLRLGTGGERRWALGWRRDDAGVDAVKIEYWLE